MLAEHWLITGASGQLGGHLVRQLAGAGRAGEILALAGKGDIGAPGVALRRIDLADLDALRACVASYRPTHMVHAAAMTSVADAYQQPALAERVNTDATRALAEAAVECGARFVFCSTDMVFAGDAAPYSETSPANPLSQYGRTKAAAERLLQPLPRALAVRIPLMYGFACTTRPTTFAQQVAALKNGQPLKLFTDEFRTPIWVADAAAALLALARGEQTGILHVAGPHRLSRYEMGEQFAHCLEISKPNLVPISRLSIAAAEPRPADLSLNGEQFIRMFPRLTLGPIRRAAFEKIL